MAQEWLSALEPYGKPALIGAASGLVTGLLLRRLVKSLLLTVAFAAAVYLLVASTTDWLQTVDLPGAGREAVEYAKAHRTAAWDTARQYLSDHLAGSVGFASGILAGLALSGRGFKRKPQAS